MAGERAGRKLPFLRQKPPPQPSPGVPGEGVKSPIYCGALPFLRCASAIAPEFLGKALGALPKAKFYSPHFVVALPSAPFLLPNARGALPKALFNLPHFFRALPNVPLVLPIARRALANSSRALPVAQGLTASSRA